MNRQTLPGMIRDLLTTGDESSRLANLELIVEVAQRYAPPGVTVTVATDDARALEYLMTGV